MKNIALWVVIALIMVMLFHLFNQPASEATTFAYSEFIEMVDKGEIKEVVIQGNEIKGSLTDGTPFETYVPNEARIVERLTEKNIMISAKPSDDSPWYMSVLISWIPMLLLVGVWIFFMRQMQAGGTKAMSFGRSKAKLMSQDKIKITFADVAGVNEAKEELEEIIEFLKEPKRFTSLGGRIPKGVLLLGPPGTGKTLLAKAVAGEAGVPFFSMSGSDFVEMFVGVGASRVRDLFAQGKQHAPCIIFIDEIDAVGRHRGAGLGGGHDEREQTLNQLLVEMDGFESNEGVILMAATNRPDVLDPALLRPGRFDRQVVVASPDVKGREGILKVHCRNIPLAEDVNLQVLAKATPGFSGADLSNLVNEAALLAARKKRNQVSMEDLEMAKDKVLMGVERKSMVISEEEKNATAYHEAGHALVAKKLPNADPVYKVSIIPRGRAMGVTQQLPIDDRHTYKKDYLLATISVLMGGRVAEEVALGCLTTGAGNDIERASDMARHMVTEWGMSSLGPLSFGKVEQEMFLGREISKRVDYSELTAQKIDEEIKAIITGCYEKTKEIITENIDALHRIAKRLLEKEILDGAEIDKIIQEGTA
ncbi:MAG: ATP-dependent zinc metalloprotease FtsH [Pseudomonadota bacterium]|nr:ATP-dependent zinc metalloprotease FtsH [Pseudomonadota bacterium]HPX19156.1 ATP-dependent zinc metalloprotease FtsH [Deltaproteobacteria bacterium]